MKRSFWSILVFSLLACSIAVSGKSAAPEHPRNIILIGWDGAQRNHLKECLDRDELPNLKKLSCQGNLVAIDVLRTTDTKSGWTQILTGYEPEITGVYSNSRYQPIPKGYTVFERLEQFFGSDNIATVAVIGKKGHVDCEGPVHRLLTNRELKLLNPKKKIPDGTIVTENGKKYLDAPGKPYFYTKDGMDLFINGLETNTNVGSKALELLDEYSEKPFFFFVHFAEVDHQGHKFGENSKEYNDALISCDNWTGEIMQKLRDLKLYDQTLIYVTADHGFDEGMRNHSDAPYVFLATNDHQIIRRGTRADITPTILDRFGVDLGKINPPLQGHPLSKPYTQSIW